MRRTAVVLPGRRYGHAQPGLRLTELALEQSGFDLVQVEWPDEGMPDDVAGSAAVVAELAEPLLAAEPHLVVAKSLGTLVAPLAAERGTAAIWLTPLLHEPLCRDAIVANRARQLLLGGPADFAWDEAAAHQVVHAGASVVELPGADHGFEVPGDAVASAETLVLLARAVLEFVG